jgi:amino acid adenylation domain-containing protein
MAAFKVMMMRYSNQQDIVVGTPIANRNRAEIEGLIGFFVNTLVMRTDLGGEPSFREVIRREREVALGAYAHQDLPFEKLVDELQPERDMSRSPLFQVMFALQNAPMSELTLSGLALETVATTVLASKYDLTLDLAEDEESIKGAIEYNSDLFDEATMMRMARHFEQLCESIAADPEQKIWQLQMLSKAEQHQLVVEWNQTSSAYPSDECIHEQFERQVRHSPEKVALTFEQEQMTYEELNARANQLGRYLRRAGVRAEVAVGICVERSVEMVIGIMGILKSGGCYVPLDPSYPKERLAFMLEDAQIEVLVSEEKLKEALPKYEGETILIDSEWEKIATLSKENIDSGASSDNLAYVMYTSGSTGKPKGVAITQRAVLRLVKETDYVDFGPEEVILQYAPISFDASTFEIWGALLNGGRLAIARRGRRTTRELGEEIREKRVSTLWLATALFQQMVEEEIDSLRGVKQLLAGGDVLPEAQVERAVEELRGTRLINGYGPTENTTFTTTYELTGDRNAGKVPIGRPICKTRVYILGKNMEVVPVGVEGEMYTGGEGLAREYYKRGGMTAERFVPDPYSEEGGERLYKTGDVVRYLADGNIEFIGRADSQVKIRGFRIELEEIEAVLNEHDEILKSAVIVKLEANGDKRIIAYIVPRDEEAPVNRELRKHVKERLPDYMLPSVFVVLPDLPITANGKIDRAALPEPEQSRGGMESDYIPPRTPIEEVVAGIWSELLRVEQIAIHDNFFDLGGHSLLATRVNSWLRDVFEIDLPIGSLFERPTIAGLSEIIEDILKTEEGISAPRISPVSRDSELLLSFAQQRLWFLNQLEPNNSFYNLSFAVRLSGHLDLDAMERSFGEIVRRHETLRTTLPMMNGHPLQLIAPPEPVKLQLMDLSTLSEAEQALKLERLSSIEAQKPFDLEQGPLWRILLLRFSPTDHVVLLTMHHIISDGWSMGLLIKEMGVLYEATLKGEQSPLEELPIQYADYAAWQRRWLQGDVLDTQLTYWKTQLEEFPPELRLPSDRPRPKVESYQRKDLKFEISKPVSDRVKSLSRHEGVTLFMTLLAAFKTLLYRYTRQDDILVGTPIANRNRAEIEALIGFFVNTLTIRTDLSGDPTFRELLKRVREVALKAYTHQDLPFERIVEALQPKRDKRLNPLFQILFILQNSPMTALKLPDIVITTLDTEVRSAMFDMIVIMVDSEFGLKGTITYNIDMYDAATINGMIDHYKVILDEASRDPEIRLLDMPIRKNRASAGGGQIGRDIEPFDF